MATPLHATVEAICGQKPALVFSFGAFKGFMLNNFRKAKDILLSKSVPIEGYPDLSAKFAAFTTNHPTHPSEPDLELQEKNGEIYVIITTPLHASIAIHDSRDPAREFSTVELDIDGFYSKIAVKPPALVIGAPEFEVKPTVINSANRAEAIAESGIPEEAVQRVEGGLAYMMQRRLVLSLFATISNIDLLQLFTAFELKGSWELVTKDNSLIVIPSDGISIKEDNGCPQRDAVPDLVVSAGQMQAGTSMYAWPINTGGVPATVSHLAYALDGFASIYLPKPVLEHRFSTVAPAITISETHDSFIGYDVTLLAACKYIGLTIVPGRYGVLIDLEFTTQGNANVTVDVPCVGRMDLANARFKGDTSTLSVFVSFVLSPNGKLSMDCQVEQLQMGKVEVTIQLFSKWLAFAGGKGVVVGFILDNIVKRILERVLPNKMRKIIKDTINSNNIQLMDLESLDSYTRYGRFTGVSYSGNSDSVLVGLIEDQG